METVSDNQLARFSASDSAIAEMSAAYLPLTIRDVNDTAGYKAVHAARMVVKNKRVEVEKLRKELKADALEYGRRVDAEAKRITSLLEPIESHLSQEEEAYEAEKERIKNAARLKAEAEERAKREAEEAKIRAEREAEEARLRVEREKLEAERRAMEEEREKIAAERARQQAEQDRIDAENWKLEMEKARAEAMEKAIIETEKRLIREAEEKAAREKARQEEQAAAKAQAEALRPDREKLLWVVKAISYITVPEVSGDAQAVYHEICGLLVDVLVDIRNAIDKALPAVGSESADPV
ncbi:MAG: hypothetical protein ABFD92_21560 [Planctomycetaceae bacterium]